MRSQATALRERDDRAARLRAAASVRASISEPHLLAARIAAREGGGGRLALEPLDAPSLEVVLAARGRLGPRTAVAVVAGATRAIVALEQAGLVARDIMPRTILLDSERGAVLADFGIPPELAPLDRADSDPDLLFRAPEERGGGHRSPRGSVYSLGATLLAALTGEAPPERLGAAQERRGRELRPTLESVIARAMTADPARRYADAPEMASAAVEAVRASERLGRARVKARQTPEPVRPKQAKPGRVIQWRRPARVPDDEATAQREPTDQEAAEAARKAREADEHRLAEAARKAREAEEHRLAEAARKAREADERRAVEAACQAQEAAERDAAERDRRAVEAAERQQRAAERAESERVESERLRAERAQRKAAKRAGRQRQAEQAAERRAAQVAKRKRARAAGRRPRDERVGHRTAAAAHSKELKPVPGRRGHDHLAAASRPQQKPATPAAAAKNAGVRKATAAAVIAAVVAGAAAAVIAPSGGGSTEAAPVRVQSGDLSVLLPAGWVGTHSRSVRLGPVTDRTDAAAPERDATLTAAVMREPARTAAELRSLEAPAAAGPAATRLERVEALRFGGVSTRPGWTGSAYFLHTTGASVLVLCQARGEARARSLRECGAAAATARLAGHTPLTLQAAANRRRAARRALAGLGAARIADRDRMAAAVTGEELTDASLDLQVRYYEASRRIQATGLPGIAARRLVAALARTGHAYGAIAGTVIDGDQVAYDTARGRVVESEARLMKLLKPGIAELVADQS